MTDFKREGYIVIKRKDFVTEQDEQSLRDWMDKFCVEPVECVVVESDWPIYEQVWDMVQRQVEGRQLLVDELLEQLADERHNVTEANQARRAALRVAEDANNQWSALLSKVRSARNAIGDSPMRTSGMTACKLLDEMLLSAGTATYTFDPTESDPATEVGAGIGESRLQARYIHEDEHNRMKGELEDKICTLKEDLSVARQSLYEVAEHRRALRNELVVLSRQLD